MKTIDVHAHILVGEVGALARKHEGWKAQAEQAAALSGAASNDQNRKLMSEYAGPLTQPEARIAAMDTMRVDIQAVSTVPTHYHYWAERGVAEELVASANDRIAAICRQHPDRFVGLGTVALQHPELAVTQLEHAIRTLHLRGVMISTAVNGVELADPRHEPFWSAAEALRATIFIHPMGCSLGARLTPYYFSNVIGNPAETTLALAHMVFAGMFDRHPRLKVCAAHGGGYFPFYIGRFDHGWRVRPEAHTCRMAPSEYLKRIWFDSIVFAPAQLRFLAEQAGASQIVIGTDFPFDMGTREPLEFLESVPGLSEPDRDAIRGGNAARLLGIDAR